jgi:hypothetical protein
MIDSSGCGDLIAVGVEHVAGEVEIDPRRAHLVANPSSPGN